jgi:DUF4097 and DUF4098 domain-containing protein YvlB
MTKSSFALTALLVFVLPAAPADAQGPRPPRDRNDRRERLQDSRNGPEVVERFSRTAKIGRDGTLDVSNVAGTIVITGGGGNDATIDAVKRTRNTNEEQGRARLREIDIQVTESNNRVEVRTVYPREQRINGVVDYTVAVPEGVSVTARSVSGAVRVTNVRGELRLETVSGDIDTSGGRRVSSLRSVSGGITVTDAEATDLVTIRTVSGHQNVKGLKARSLEANSVSGEVRLAGAAVDRADIRTVSGRVDFNGQLARSGRYEVSTHSGDVSIAVADAGFDVEASTFSGDFRSDYAVTLRGGGDTNRRGRRFGPNRAIRGTYRDGGAILDLRTFSGDIAIVKP